MTDTVNAPLLWSMHILGPDDMYPAPDLATAFKWCEYVNSELAPRTPDVLCAAIPALWDGTPEQHAKSLPEAMKGWAVPAQPKAPKVEQEPAGYIDPNVLQGMRVGRYRDATIYPTCSSAGVGSTQPLYTHPAPVSDELLEALEAIKRVAEMSKKPFMGLTQGERAISSCGVISAHVDRLIAKHKGPQS